MQITSNIYDEVAYGGFINPNTHPNQLAVMGFLHGLNPAPVEHCRVLEIGCSEGRNLIPMAYAIPGATFVGFDLAAQPIARGRLRIQALGLTNIELFQADILALDPDRDPTLAPFDYIIAHGVYAWVPEPVRDRLLALCRQLLTPEGIAFISYNALPGGHLRNLVRDILTQSLQNTHDRLSDVNRSLDFLQYIIDSRPEPDPLRNLLASEMKNLRRKGPSIIFHDELAEGYSPVSFSNFIAHARRHGLQYVSEAVIPPPTDPCFQPSVAAKAKALSDGDPIAEEQTLDFVRFRMYRETLLCRSDRSPDCPVILDLDLSSLGSLRLASPAKLAPGDLAHKTATSAAYTIPSGMRVHIHHPALVLLVDALIDAWPRSLPTPEIEAQLATNNLAFDTQLLTHLFRAIVAQLIQLRAWEPPVADHIASHPTASATSREDAALRPYAASLLHTPLDLSDPLVRQLLFLLDGTRDRAAILHSLQAANPGIAPEDLVHGIEPTLRTLHRACILLAGDFG